MTSDHTVQSQRLHLPMPIGPSSRQMVHSILKRSISPIDRSIAPEYLSSYIYIVFVCVLHFSIVIIYSIIVLPCGNSVMRNSISTATSSIVVRSVRRWHFDGLVIDGHASKSKKQSKDKRMVIIICPKAFDRWAIDCNRITLGMNFVYTSNRVGVLFI